MKTLQQLIGYQNLTGLINNPAGGVPDDILPASFMSTDKNIEGDVAQWTEIGQGRTTMRRSNYGDASQRREQQVRSRKAAKCAHFFEHQFHNVNVLNAIAAFNSVDQQEQGRQEIDSQVVEFRRLVNNTRLAMVYSMLTLGKIYFDGNGNLLPSSSGAVVTVDFGVPAGNLGTCDALGAGAIIGASWATATTDIIGDVGQFQQAARILTGLRLKHAFYGINLPLYLLTNNFTKELINRSPELRSSISAGVIPNGFLGLDWHPAYEAFYEDSGGTNRTFFTADMLTLTPEVSKEWYTLFKGSYQIPTSLGLSQTATAALSQFAKVYGAFSYAKVSDDPAGIKHYVGDTVLPVLVNPSAIFIVDTTP